MVFPRMPVALNPHPQSNDGHSVRQGVQFASDPKTERSRKEILYKRPPMPATDVVKDVMAVIAKFYC